MDTGSGILTPVERHDVLGVPVDLVTMDTALQRIRHWLDHPGPPQLVIATNPEKVIAARREPALLDAIRQAALVIPDGIGVVAAARLAGRSGIARVPGSELMPALCALAARESHPVFLYGARQEVVERAATLLEQTYPGLRVAGTRHGYATETELPAVLESINRSSARILFVGLGSPRQELWMARHAAALTGVRVCQGVGGTFDAICGHPPRAPAMIRRMNLEWLYRLVSQPTRLHRQSALPLFVAQVLREQLFGNSGRA